MTHNHAVLDKDAYYKIDSDTRIIKSSSSSEKTLIQYDHKSERVTFQLPRYIEGHDMTLCNSVRVHYINIDIRTKEDSRGFYDVEDLQISPNNENFVVFSWVIYKKATKFVGPLKFLIKFSCVQDDGIVDYSWNTAFGAMKVYPGMDNIGDFTEDEGVYDILTQWYDKIKKELIDSIKSESNKPDNTKADNLIYNNEEKYLQLTSHGEPIGDPVHVDQFFTCINSDDILDLLAETGIVDPISDETGAMLADGDGAILIT